MHTRRILHALAALGLALVLAACGGDDAHQLSDTAHNDADVTFASDMLQHHAQALSMVDLAADRPLDPEVQRLAEDIRAAQAPEIETFSGWLTEWGEEIPETMRDHANSGHGHDSDGDSHGDSGHGSHDTGMPGMMSEEDMAELADAPDADFQTMWLEMMIEHHEGAVEMAKTEQSDGRHRPAVELAKDIESSQSDEIDAMKGLLD